MTEIYFIQLEKYGTGDKVGPFVHQEHLTIRVSRYPPRENRKQSADYPLEFVKLTRNPKAGGDAKEIEKWDEYDEHGVSVALLDDDGEQIGKWKWIPDGSASREYISFQRRADGVLYKLLYSTGEPASSARTNALRRKMGYKAREGPEREVRSARDAELKSERHNKLDTSMSYILHLLESTSTVDPTQNLVNIYNLAIMSDLAYQEGSAVGSECVNKLKNLPTRRAVNTNRNPGHYTGSVDILNYAPVVHPVLPENGYSLSESADDYAFFNNSDLDTQGFILNCAYYILISFRGTEKKWETWEEWLVDVSVPKADFGDEGKVHLGFLSAFSSVQPFIDDVVESTIASPLGDDGYKPIFVCGHSLGGALAVLAAAHLKSSYPEATIAVYTYGQPRVGDRDFASHFNNRLVYTRVRHSEDPIPMMPATGFYHFGRELLVQSASEGHFDDRPRVESEPIEIVDEVEAVSQLPHLPKHDMKGSYLESLQNFLCAAAHNATYGTRDVKWFRPEVVR